VNRLQLEFDPRLDKYPEETIRVIVNTVWETHSVPDAEITIIFGDDELLSRLKETFFHVQQLTDVIAFRFNESESTSPEGEIYISLPRARENAALFNEPEPREIARLIIHGCLHLLGFDDQTDNDRRAMRTREETFLSQTPWKALIPLRQE